MSTETQSLLIGLIAGLLIGLLIGMVASQDAMEKICAETECAGYNQNTAEFEIYEMEK